MSQHSAQTSSHKLTHLKPSTASDHNVTFIDSSGEEAPCFCGDKTLMLEEMGDTQMLSSLSLFRTLAVNFRVLLSWRSLQTTPQLPNLR